MRSELTTNEQLVNEKSVETIVEKGNLHFHIYFGTILQI